jgi:hypothetical protein
LSRSLTEMCGGTYTMRIPADSIHSFRANPSTHSDPFRPLIPF